MSPADESRALLRRVLVDRCAGEVALVSSFGAESAVLLHLVAAIDPATPVIFLDTGKLFAETLAYRDRLAHDLALVDLRIARPSARALGVPDPDGDLWSRDPDLCCWTRKVEPLDVALDGFDAWITGRKRYQADTRGTLPAIEPAEAGRTKVNPLAGWTEPDVARYVTDHALPPHPLVARGYRSIGCAPCTRPTRPGEDARAGRWSGRDKVECGIHGRG
ncbi:MAG TPA: phosphoadenylyl-sulfate reductase, partial [Acetobacteraceae bacterium]|nr:phosphoadenylyl-sulfate reductase [Acetobacteraceae bacterium]